MKESHLTDVSDRRLASRQTAFHEIPIIDIAALVDGSDPESVARKIGEVCETVGFFPLRERRRSVGVLQRRCPARPGQ
jgi:hypothetical protein